jgi:RNA:NAD 2'-phosphotransferase (TPT1/KptA family)
MNRRTPGRWALRGHQIRADEGRGQHIATYQTNMADGVIIAAAPELLDLLLRACATLDASERASQSHGTADDIRERLAHLGLILPGLDEHGEDSCRKEPRDTNPYMVAPPPWGSE